MISLHGPHGPVDHAGLMAGGGLPEHAVWIDLLDPTEEEARQVEAATGLRVPSRAALSEVESSSRLRRLKSGGLSLSSPMITFDRTDLALKPLGFVLTKEHLVTIRFADLRSYDTVKTRVAEHDGDCTTSIDIFLLVIEELVDGLADTLEEMSSDLGSLSTRIFDFDPAARAGSDNGSRGSPKRRDLALRRLLRSIGRQGKSLAKVRASLLGLERIVPFVKDSCPQMLGADAEESPRFDTLSRDIDSLDEFETRQSETLQFLLDAALGLINIEQNNAFRVLTVVSVVGIPPTLIASMYGMNFKHMPELEWAYGYPYGLALIALSALIPILIFRVKGWV
ncbi:MULTISPECIES: magnesium transporter CorA family protein [Methylobacterium]|uniref:Magnesium transport protein CorA n=1 Tax=Methylobacterium thuringiense TaxID=1003091 RepID=A0ABQ4TU63_9HYPH|nr:MULTISPECIES: magnesium transporter CorA family protein [Methylobacterium]TXN23358.1 magnesium transporter CorA family protein [Methylobacterium sp. WL9]GJE57503.1 Magnesium transport protein CorA [Methylobacterium thuringiense]